MCIQKKNKQTKKWKCVSSAGSLLLHLLDWVKLHKADVDEKARDVLQSESPAEHHDYWDAVSAAGLQMSFTPLINVSSVLTQTPVENRLWFDSETTVLTNLICGPMQVIGYVLQGSLDKARPMLVKQANLQPAARKMYKLMDNLLSKMPFYNVRGATCILFSLGSPNLRKVAMLTLYTWVYALKKNEQGENDLFHFALCLYHSQFLYKRSVIHILHS